MVASRVSAEVAMRLRFLAPSLTVLALAIAVGAPAEALAAKAKAKAKAKAPAGAPAAVVALAGRQLSPDGRPVPNLTARLFKPVTVTPDGVTDWHLDTADLQSMGFCGTGGCEQLIIVSRGKAGYAVAFDHQTIDLKLTYTLKGLSLIHI